MLDNMYNAFQKTVYQISADAPLIRDVSKLLRNFKKSKI